MSVSEFDHDFHRAVIQWTTVSILVVVLLTTLGMWGCPRYNVWHSEMQGRALYANAEYARKVQVAQAEGERDAAKLRAEAIAIVGKAATEFPQYRQQEFIGAFAEALHNGRIQQIVYVATEGGIPILEAGRMVQHAKGEAK